MDAMARKVEPHLGDVNFRSTEQRREACLVFVGRAGHPGLWTGAIPPGAGTNSVERALLAVVEAVWNRRNLITFSQLLDDLGPKELRALGEFLSAMSDGPDAIDTWIQTGETGGTV